MIGVILLLFGRGTAQAASNLPLGQSAQSLTLANAERDLDYLLFLPSTYYTTPLRKWPLIVFLHGSDEIGEDLELVKGNGIPAIIEKKKDFEFIVVSPQCPPDQRWSPRLVKTLIDAVTRKLHVDTARIYLTGYSMGGYGTWDTAAAYPRLFAAIAPVCGGGDVQQVDKMTALPVWAFHGAKDINVPVEESVRMVDALNRIGGNAKLTIYPELAHDSWTVTYANPALYRWFLRHKKGPLSSILSGVRKAWRRLVDAAQILNGTILVPFETLTAGMF
jgi:predicted peptidase